MRCDAETYVTFQVHDAAGGTETVVDVNSFGLGNVNGDGRLGYYNVMMTNPRVDGSTVLPFATNSGNPGQHGNTTGAQLRKGGFTMGWRQSGAPVLQSGKVFEADLVLSAFLAGSADIRGALTESAPLRGSLIISYAFGL